MWILNRKLRSLKSTFVVKRSEECLKKRCACLFDLSYEQSKKFLFLDNMHSTDRSQESSIQLVFVRKSVYLTYFDTQVFNDRDNESIASSSSTEESHRSDDFYYRLVVTDLLERRIKWSEERKWWSRSRFNARRCKSKIRTSRAIKHERNVRESRSIMSDHWRVTRERELSMMTSSRKITYERSKLY